MIDNWSHDSIEEPSNAVLSNKKRKLESNERRLQHEVLYLF